MDWYFDFVSPYAYIQLERHYDWLASLRPTVKPVLLAGILDHWGQRGPAEIVPKRTFTYRQVQWLAAHEGVALRFPPKHPFNPIKALRLAVAIDGGLAATREIYRYFWRDGLEADSEDGWRTLVSRLGASEAEARIASPEVKERLKKNGEEALAQGVFGVPTLVVDGHLFWGYDATAMAMDHLRDPGTFATAEMRRLETLPVGASRVPR